MPQPRKVDRGTKLCVQVPASILGKVQLELHSEIEGRVPFGAMSKLTTELLSDWLRSRGVVV